MPTVAVDAGAGHDFGLDNGSDRARRIRDAVEAALSDIILLGTEEHVRLAERAARELVAGQLVHTHDLVVSLRNFIRKALDLEPIPADLVIPRQGPARLPAAGGRGKDEGKKDDGGGGGGMQAGGGSIGFNDGESGDSHDPTLSGTRRTAGLTGDPARSFRLRSRCPPSPFHEPPEPCGSARESCHDFLSRTAGRFHASVFPLVPPGWHQF